MKMHAGVVHGNTIELSENPGLPDGEEVLVHVLVSRPKRERGSGLLRCAGALADSWTERDDQILEELQRDRLQTSHRELPE